MRPTPDEVISSVRTLLKADIGASLPPSAQPQLKRLLGVLRDGRWNDAAFALMRENAAFAELARVSATRLEQDGPSSLAQLAIDLAASAQFELPWTFAEANEINRRLRVEFVRLIEAIRDEKMLELDSLCHAIGTALAGLRMEN